MKASSGECSTLEPNNSAARAALTVLIVDPDVKARARLTAIVQAAGWQATVFGSAEELLADPRLPVPGCILLDVDLPGLSGLDLQQFLAQRAEMSVVFASACQDVRVTVKAMKAGAVNFLTKPVHADALLGAIREALERSRVSLSRDAEEGVLRRRLAALSEREREVMKLVIGGRLNKQIAGELHIAEITVKVHRGRVMRKLRAASLADLVRLGTRLGVPYPKIDERHAAKSANRGLPLQRQSSHMLRARHVRMTHAAGAATPDG